MLVLRFTLGDPKQGGRTQEVETDRREVEIGSDPMADITLQGVGLAPRAVRLRQVGTAAEVEVLGSDRRVTISVGDEVVVGDLTLKLLALPEPETPGAFAFGSYEDDPALPELRTFKLSPPPSPGPPADVASNPAATPAVNPAVTPESSPSVPRADGVRAPLAGEIRRRGAPPPQSGRPAPTTPSPSQSKAGQSKAGQSKAGPPKSGQPQGSQSRATQTQAVQTKPAGATPSQTGAKETRSGQTSSGQKATSGTRRAPGKPKLTAEQKLALLQPVKFSDPSFGEALVTQLKRAPFFAFSVGFHLLLAILLSLFSTTRQPPPPEGPGAIIASMSAEEEELGQETPEVDDDLGLPQAPSELPDLPEDLPEEEVPPTPIPEPPSPFREDMKRLEDQEVQPVDIGLMPGLRIASNQRHRRRPKMPRVDMAKPFTKGAAGSANKRSADIARAQLGSGRLGNAKLLDELRPEDILVVGGVFDHIDRVLDALRIKYVTKSPYALVTPKQEKFSTYKVVFWNCGEALSPQRTKIVTKNLQKFVRNGGYLFTTDWGIATVLVHAFPGYLKTNGNRAHLPEMVLPIEPNRSARQHPLLEGVFHPTTQGKWWLEQASFDLGVGRKDAVTVLIESPMLASTFNRSPAVAATFTYGRGRVLHTMGHYFQEAGNLAGTLSAHRLALNFVLMRLDQDGERGRLNRR